MKPTPLFLALLPILSSLAPHAAAAGGARSLCASIQQVKAGVQSCEDNDAFIAQGEACLDKLEASIAAARKGLQKSFSQPVGAQQQEQLDSAAADYQLSSASFAELLAEAKAGVAEMDAYMAALEPPEDADEEDVTGGDVQRYMNSVNCYGETKRSLTSIQSDFQNKASQLAAAKASADAHGGLAQGSGENLSTQGQARALSSARSSGHEAGPMRHASQAPAQDVTGLVKDETRDESLSP